jgi:hypothetical protein
VTWQPDRKRIQEEAVGTLRNAVALGREINEPLRACWYRDTAFATALLVVSLGQRFGPSSDIRLITAFVARIRAARGGPTGAFPSREAEALIRGYLGELAMLDHVDPAKFSYAELGIATLGRLLEEWRPSPEEVDDLFARAGAVRWEMAERFPQIAEAEDDWFASGMPDSPFATLGGEPPWRTDEER